jgi:hypothetical protein
VAANALELARRGVPRAPLYLTGQVGGRPFSLHAEGERVFLTGAEGRREVDLVPPADPAGMPQPVCPEGQVGGPWAEAAGAGPPAPGASPLDELGGLVDLGAPVEDPGPAPAREPEPGEGTVDLGADVVAPEGGES